MASYAMLALVVGLGLSWLGSLWGARWLGVPAFALAGWLFSSAKFATDAPATSRPQGILGWFARRSGTRPVVAVLGLTLVSGGVGFTIGAIGYGSGTLPRGVALGVVCAVMGGVVGVMRVRSEREPSR